MLWEKIKQQPNQNIINKKKIWKKKGLKNI